MKSTIIVLVACITAGAAVAQEPVGCDKFKWPLDNERAMLTGTDIPIVSSGGTATHPLPFAMNVALMPFADAKLPMPPERTPRSLASFAAVVNVPAPAQPGTYNVSLSSEAWVDVVQAGHFVKSAAFTGAMGCEGIRKSVKFNLAAEPFAIQISGVGANTIKVAVTRD